MVCAHRHVAGVKGELRRMCKANSAGRWIGPPALGAMSRQNTALCGHISWQSLTTVARYRHHVPYTLVIIGRCDG